jgi:hypothetical protein
VPKPASGDEFGARAQVRAQLRGEGRSASDYRLDAAALRAVPRTDAGELLKSVPGMAVARIEGDGVAHRLMLRGFDADHGQDIELKVDDVPVNQPSHVHAQGYADLGFVIPETVRGLRVIEGVYDPAQSDFAVAGTAEFELGVAQRGLQVTSSYGAFDTFRETAVWAPQGQSEDTFAAVSVKKTHGFGQNRASQSAAAVAQGSFGKGPLKLTLHGSAYGARADTANVVRRDDIASGKLGFYDVYPYATARGQDAESARAQLSAKLRYLGESGDNAELTLFYVFNDFRFLSNYTGFSETSQLVPSWSGRGDLNEQLNGQSSVGARSRYRSVRFAPASWFAGTFELGLTSRLDRITQSQNLVQAPENSVWDRRLQADIVALDIGAYADLDLEISRWVRLKGGLRADSLSYRVNDGLKNTVPSGDTPRALPGASVSAAGIALGPRAVLEIQPFSKLVLSAAYGEGYRSPQALLLRDGQSAPFTTVRSADLGARLSLGPRDAFGLRGSGYLTQLSKDVVFDPLEGSTASVGPSRRLGFVLYGDARPWSWLLASASVTYVNATLQSTRGNTTDDGIPPLRRGDRLPYVPPWVLRIDNKLEHTLYEFRGAPVIGQAGLGFTYWSARPLPFGKETPAVSLLDLSLRASYRVFSLEGSVFNLLDAQWAAQELVYASNWNPAAQASDRPARTIQAGAPRTWLLTLGITL